MERYKKLLGNSAIFALGNLGSKLISFVLIPFYTFVLSRSQFGTVDLITSGTNFLLPVITLSIFDAVFRFTMDKHQDKKIIFMNGLVISFVGCLVGILIIPVLSAFDVPMPLHIYMLLISSAILNLFSNFARAIGKVKIFAFGGILGTLVTASANVILLFVFRTGVEGYLNSIIIANLAVILFFIVMTKSSIKIDFNYVNKNIIYKMLIYSLPLIPNAFSWWINSSADKYFILLFIGPAANGIYAVASKIPTLLNVVNQIFFQSWQISAVEEVKSEDASAFYSKIFNYFWSVQFIGIGIILFILKPLMTIIVAENYDSAWKYVPFLLIAVMYSSMSGFLGTTYTAVKRTRGIFITTIIGSICNIIFGLIFVPIFGIQGASFAGLLSFGVVLLIRIIDTRKFIVIKTDIYNITLNHLFIFLMIYILFTIENQNVLQISELIVLGFVLIINYKIFKPLLRIKRK